MDSCDPLFCMPRNRIIMKKIIFFLNCLLNISLITAGFTGETLVKTPKGLVQLQSLKVGDRVVCYKGDGLLSEKPIQSIQGRKIDEIFKVITRSDDIIYSSKDARFLLPKEQKWTYACDLQPGSFLLKQNMERVEVKGVEKLYKSIDIFDIGVKKHHNFGISENGIIVHNLNPLLAPFAVEVFEAGLALYRVARGAKAFHDLIQRYKDLQKTPVQNTSGEGTGHGSGGSLQKTDDDQFCPCGHKCDIGCNCGCSCGCGKQTQKHEKTSLDRILDDAIFEEEADSGVKIYGKNKSFEDGLRDFESLNPTDVKPIKNGKGLTGKLPDGTQANIRWDSRDGRSTLEIYDPIRGRSTVKIRYGKEEIGDFLGKIQKCLENFSDKGLNNNISVGSGLQKTNGLGTNLSGIGTITQSQTQSFLNDIISAIESNTATIIQKEIFKLTQLNKEGSGKKDPEVKGVATISQPEKTVSNTKNTETKNTDTKNTGTNNTGTNNSNSKNTGTQSSGGNGQHHKNVTHGSAKDAATKAPLSTNFDQKTHGKGLENKIGLSRLPQVTKIVDSGKGQESDVDTKSQTETQSSISESKLSIGQQDTTKILKKSLELSGFTEDEVNRIIAEENARQENEGAFDSSTLPFVHDPKKVHGQVIQKITTSSQPAVSKEVQEALDKLTQKQVGNKGAGGKSNSQMNGAQAKDKLAKPDVPGETTVLSKNVLELTTPGNEENRITDFSAPEPYMPEERNPVSIVVKENGVSIHCNPSGNTQVGLRRDGFNDVRREGWSEEQDLKNEDMKLSNNLREINRRVALDEIDTAVRKGALAFDDLDESTRTQLIDFQNDQRKMAHETRRYQAEENGHLGYVEIRPKKWLQISNYSESQDMTRKQLDAVLSIVESDLRNKMASLKPEDLPAFQKKHKCDAHGRALPGYSLDGTPLFMRSNNPTTKINMVESFIREEIISPMLKNFSQRIQEKKNKNAKISGIQLNFSNENEKQQRRINILKNQITGSSTEGKQDSKRTFVVSEKSVDQKTDTVTSKNIKVELSVTPNVNNSSTNINITAKKMSVDEYNAAIKKFNEDFKNTGISPIGSLKQLKPDYTKPFKEMTPSERNAAYKDIVKFNNDNKYRQPLKTRLEHQMEGLKFGLDTANKAAPYIKYGLMFYNQYQFFAKEEIRVQNKWDVKNPLDVHDQYDLNDILAYNNICLTETQRRLVGQQYDRVKIGAVTDWAKYYRYVSLLPELAREDRNDNIIRKDNLEHTISDKTDFPKSFNGLQDVLELRERRKFFNTNELKPQNVSELKKVVEKEYEKVGKYLNEENDKQLDILLASNQIKLTDQQRLRIAKQCAINLKINPEYFKGWMLDLNADNKDPNISSIKNIEEVWRVRRLRALNSLMATKHITALSTEMIVFLKEMQGMRKEIYRDLKQNAELLIKHKNTIDGTYTNEKYNKKLDSLLNVGEIKLTKNRRLKLEKQLALNCHINPYYKDAFEKYDVNISVGRFPFCPEVIKNINDVFVALHNLYRREREKNSEHWPEIDQKFQDANILEYSEDAVIEQMVNYSISLMRETGNN